MKLENIVNTGKKFLGRAIVGAGLIAGGFGVANASEDWGYLFLENNLNNSERHVNIVRDDEYREGAKDGLDTNDSQAMMMQPSGYPNCYSDVNDGNFHLWSDVRPNDSNAPYDIIDL